MPNYQIENILHRRIIRKFKRRKFYSSFRVGCWFLGLENLREENFIHLLEWGVDFWGVDLADMQSLSKYNKGIRYLLCTIHLFSKYAWVDLLKTKKVLLMHFKK